jgi:hypothetical protein
LHITEQELISDGKEKASTEEDRFVSGREADAMFNQTPPTRKKLEAMGLFPKFVPLYPGCRYGGYLLSELRECAKNRVESSRLPDAPDRSIFAGPGRGAGRPTKKKPDAPARKKKKAPSKRATEDEEATS